MKETKKEKPVPRLCLCGKNAALVSFKGKKLLVALTRKGVWKILKRNGTATNNKLLLLGMR